MFNYFSLISIDKLKVNGLNVAYLLNSKSLSIPDIKQYDYFVVRLMLNIVRMRLETG
jgi:hypothetical protein